MRQATFQAGLRFPFPENGSSLDIRRRIGRWAANVPTAAQFPWGLTKHLPHVLCKREPSFRYAECVLFCCGEAARHILSPLYPGYRRLLLATVIKHQIQIAGIFHL